MRMDWSININKGLANVLEQKFETAMKKAAMLVHGEVKRVLSGTRSGRMYRVPATKVMYRASSAGEAPAVRLGDLRGQYAFEIEGRGFKAVGVVGSRLKYAPMLEKGTSRMAPRPHLSVAFRNKQREVELLFGGLL